MEGDVLEAARKLYGRGEAQMLTFNLNESDMVQGLICGGNLEVLIEPGASTASAYRAGGNPGKIYRPDASVWVG